ncbi:hypothetical protein DCAR_0208191 [Daucus carota subsp. sativus]|uniref:Uncharacterized protein n=1 Tax=Daucus carota subsp. sativus TaxID=79200 RepID=A0A166EDF1_DAUCS|nr:hypothetical protein DCAR_0208191 [Daucus carota subsp. sativus]
MIPLKNTKPKATHGEVLHWPGEPSPGVEPLKVEVYLINPPELDWLGDLNPLSKVVMPYAYATPALGIMLQWEKAFSLKGLGNCQ